MSNLCPSTCVVSAAVFANVEHDRTAHCALPEGHRGDHKESDLCKWTRENDKPGAPGALTVTLRRSDVEYHRETWANVARLSGWHTEPFYAQFWVYEDGRIQDSVSHRNMKHDVFVLVEPDRDSEYESDVRELCLVNAELTGTASVPLGVQYAAEDDSEAPQGLPVDDRPCGDCGAVTPAGEEHAEDCVNAPSAPTANDMRGLLRDTMRELGEFMDFTEGDIAETVARRLITRIADAYSPNDIPATVKFTESIFRDLQHVGRAD